MEWPLLTVETEGNGGSKSTNERGPSLAGCWACRANSRDFCSALAAIVGPEQNIFKNSFVSIAQEAGQAAVLGCLSLGMSLCGGNIGEQQVLCL